MELETAAKQLEALGNPTRLAIFRVLLEKGREGAPVREIQGRLSIPASTLSHHLAKLVQAGLVNQERESRTLTCRGDFDNMDALMKFLLQNCCGKNSCIRIRH